MKNKIKNLLFLIILAPLAIAQPNPEFNNLWDLFNKKEYFKLNSRFVNTAINLPEGEKFIIGGMLDRVFNQPGESNEKLDRVLNNFRAGLSDSVMMEIYQAKMLNYVNLYDYANALKMNDVLLTTYAHLIDSADTEDYNNSLKIWKSCSELQPQTCIKSGSTRIRMKKDLAGLYNIELKINGVKSEFIFDTGANFSTITLSLAKKINLKFLEGKIKVGTATDIKVDAHLAYAEQLIIGNMKYQYVLFLVLPDEALTFAGGLYKIDGIIGFPVIKEMKEVTITEDEMIVPESSKAKDLKNLSMHSFTPVVNVVYKNDSLIFTFDTGARKTSLYNMFYRKYKSFIDKKYEQEELEIEGAGGKQTVKGFIIDKVIFNAGGTNRKLEDVKLYSENFKDKDKYFYGNMGQDFFSGSANLTINFEYMYFELTKNK